MLCTKSAKILSRAAEIFFGCRFGDSVLIPMRRVLGRNKRGGSTELQLHCFGVEQITMPVTLPRCSHSGGGPIRRGGRDGRRGRGGWGGPLPCHKRNPMLASNLRNSTLTTSISPLPCTPAPSAAVPPSSCCCQAPVCYCRCGGAGLWQPLRGQPLVEADHGESWPQEEGEAWGDGRTEEGAQQTTVSLSAALLPREGKGLTAPPPHPLPFVIVVSPS